MADCSTTAEGAASIKQAFEKGRQREKVSAKYLKECGEERGARLRGDKAVSCTLRLLLCHWIRLLLGRLLVCLCVHVCVCMQSSVRFGHLSARVDASAADIPEWSVCLCSWSSEVADKEDGGAVCVCVCVLCGASRASLR